MMPEMKPHPAGPIQYDFASLLTEVEKFIASRPHWDQSLDTPVYAVLDRALYLCQDARGLPHMGMSMPEEARIKARPAIVGTIVWFLADYCRKEGIDFGAAVDAVAAERGSI